ncbi:nitroreductase [Gelidibacter sediminis]|uniref:Nitroreductase n=1 Tax=Gelidibacter sediminis TaxID=1608710 RepID=A0A4R7PWY7_9FLAO|nr:NAD(P)H-dependent oxidoreductase [Gelidibacter sediminis]TDU39457.1 nitroreductase [Gelidibacter sediminis]
MTNYIKNLNWRYATKKFDSTKKIAAEDLDQLKDAIQLSASSYGLQPYKVLIIEDQKIKEQLKAASWGQSQITDASHVIVFANMTDFDESLINDYIENIGITRSIEPVNLKGYADFMINTLNPLPKDAKASWTAKQTYIALGNLLSAAAEFKIDACPMEGFDADQYNEILGLNEQNLNAAVVAAIGYRSEEDETQHNKKVRKPKKELFTTI